jgi:hypothetical protein
MALAVALAAVTFVVTDLLTYRRLFCATQVVRWPDGVNVLEAQMLNPSFEQLKSRH